MISSELDNLLDGKSGAYTIGPRLAGPIFDAGRGKARVDAAKARAGEALAAHDRAAKQAFREAADAHQRPPENRRDHHRAVASGGRQPQGRGPSPPTASKAANRAISKCSMPSAASSTPSSNSTDARRDRLLAVVQAYRALGGGWK